jgi:hypothetical protein
MKGTGTGWDSILYGIFIFGGFFLLIGNILFAAMVTEEREPLRPFVHDRFPHRSGDHSSTVTRFEIYRSGSGWADQDQKRRFNGRSGYLAEIAMGKRRAG